MSEAVSVLVRPSVRRRPVSRARGLVVVVLLLAGCGQSHGTPRTVAVFEASAAQAETVRATADTPEESERARREAAVRAREAAEAAERARVAAAREAFEAKYPHHGIAFHFLARVFAEPRPDATVVGYMRRGARFRASERVPGVGCAKGWYEVPGPGYVCRAEGTLIADEPPSFEPVPVEPALEDALPYAYAYAKRDRVAQYWRIPTAAEEQEVARFLAAAPLPPAPAETVADLVATAEEALAAGDGVETDAIEAPPPPGTLANQVEDASSGVVQTEESAASMPAVLRMPMDRGFYLSLDAEERSADGRAFFRTIRGGYVRAEELFPNSPTEHRGVVLGGAWRLPVAFVHRRGVQRLERESATGALRVAGTIGAHAPLIVGGDLARLDRRYVVARDGTIVARSAVRVAEIVSRPREVREGDRWIHVDLSEQTLVAYEGDTPVFATAVSTGRDEHPTPRGVFRIQSKHVSTTMDDLGSEDGAYLIEDVPWTMYFEGNYALHGAFWHDSFGKVRSHGCVNLAPADARWLFQWSLPTLPASWHGVFATRGAPGTWVYITE